jgi:hypothetical protein
MSPFRSNAQRKFLFANDPAVAEEFAAKTPKGKKLPEHVKGKKSKAKAKKTPTKVGKAKV